MKGEEESGFLAAKDKFHLAQLLKEQNLILISADEEGAKKAKGKTGFSLFPGVSVTEKLMFVRNLKVMISAGVPLPRSLELLASQARSKKFRRTINEVKDEVVRGTNFSDALLARSSVFSEIFGSMVKVGEASGKLEEVLDLLANQMARQHELSSKIKGALVYPAVIIVAMSGIGAAMLLMVVPRIAETFKELEIDLPATTRFVIWLGETLVSRWYLLAALLIALPFLFFRFSKTKVGGKALSFLSLRLPIISLIVRKANSAQAIRTLGSLISAGVPITRSLEILSESLGNVYYRESMKVATEEVTKGRKLSEALSPYSFIYSPLAIQMIAVGEETGQTAEVLDKLASFYEDEAGEMTQNLTSIIEPVIMLLIGGAVGFFAISMVQPMYSMLGAM